MQVSLGKNESVGRLAFNFRGSREEPVSLLFPVSGSHWNSWAQDLLPPPSNPVIAGWVFLSLHYFVLLFVSLFHIYLFSKNVYLFSERERRRGEGQRERERGKKSHAGSALSAESNVGLDPTNHEIMTSAEIKSQMLNWLSYPGAPLFYI